MAWEGRRSGRGISVAASAAVVLALGWLGIGFLHAAYLKYAALDSPAYAMFLLRRGWLWCHLAGGGLGVVLGLVQLLTQRWPRLWRVHRVSGRVYFAAMLVAMVGAVGLIATSPAPTGIRVAFGSTLLAWLVTGGAGLVAILRRNLAAHRRWMLGAYLVTLAPAVFRLSLAGVVAQGVAPSPDLIAWMLWGSWAVPLLLYALWLKLAGAAHRGSWAEGAALRHDRA